MIQKLFPCVLLGCLTQLSLANTFWDRDIWLDTERPYLYYQDNIPAKTPQKIKPKALKDYSTLSSLQKEYERRKNEAIIHPTEENMARFLEVNHFILEKSHRFAEQFDLTRLAYPQWDWTSSHPVMNAAQRRIEKSKNSLFDDTMHEIAHNFGLLVALDIEQPYSALVLKNLEALFRKYPFDILWLEKKGRRILYAGEKQATKLALPTPNPIYPQITFVPKPHAKALFSPFTITGFYSQTRLMEYAIKMYVSQKTNTQNSKEPLFLTVDHLRHIQENEL